MCNQTSKLSLRRYFCAEKGGTMETIHGKKVADVLEILYQSLETKEGNAKML